MANRDAPMGLVPAYHLGGGCPSRNSGYKIASAYNTSIFHGDIVKLTGTGKEIALSTAGDVAVGVFAGCEYVATDGSVVFSKYWPASTVTNGSIAAKAYVYDDPDIVFKVQDSDAGAAVDIGPYEFGASSIEPPLSENVLHYRPFRDRFPLTDCQGLLSRRLW